MFLQWIKNLQVGDSEEPDAYWEERLGALLLIEIARSDATIDPLELDAIRQAIQVSCLSIETAEIEEIITAAQNDTEQMVSLHEQIRQINASFSRQQKLSLVEQMWRVAFADGDLDKYEESMIRKLCGLIHVPHKEYIQAKLKVTEA